MNKQAQAEYEQGFNDRLAERGLDKEAGKFSALLKMMQGAAGKAKAFGGGVTGEVAPTGYKAFSRGFGPGAAKAHQAGTRFNPAYRTAREAYMPFHNVGAEALKRTRGHIGANPFGYTAAAGAGGYLLGNSGGEDMPPGHYAGDGHNHGQEGGQQYLNEQQLNKLLQSYNKGQG